MASVVIPREGEHYLFLRCTLGDLTKQTMYLRLYRVTYTPIKTTTAASFTECNYTGYAAKTINAGSGAGAWTHVLGDAVNKSYSVVTDNQDFTFPAYAGGGSVYGWYITETLAAAARCIAAMKFDTPQVCYDGLTIRLKPRIILGDLAA